MRLALVAAVVVVALLSGCVSSRVIVWRPQERRGAVAAPLAVGGEVSGPMRDYTMQHIARMCGNAATPTIIEEGTQLSGDVQAWVTPVPGGGAIAGSSSSSEYYWVFECKDKDDSALEAERAKVADLEKQVEALKAQAVAPAVAETSPQP